MKIQITFDPDDTADTAKAAAFMAGMGGTAAPVVAATATPATAPATAPAAIAPVASVTPPHDITDLDANGHPWDERIHQKAKGKTAKNLWKVTKGIDKALMAQVLSELTAAYPAQVAPAAVVTPPPSAPAAPGAPVAPAPTQSAPALVPAHQEIVDKIATILSQQPLPTVGAHEAWKLDPYLELPASIGECMGLFGCPTVDEVGTLDPAQMDSLLAGLNYIWPTQ